MPTFTESNEWIDEEVILLDGLEEALIGIGEQNGGIGQVATYSVRKILDILMTRDDICWECAFEFFNFNIAGLGLGDKTPILVHDLKRDDAIRHSDTCSCCD